jgi:hypothetical protein
MLEFGDFEAMSEEIEYIDGVPVRAEQIGFAPAEMIECGRCGKSNPPVRMDCLYCRGRLELPETVAAGIQFRHAVPEEWDPGVNLVITGSLLDADRDMISRTVSIDAETLEKAFCLEPPFPLVRTTQGDAGSVSERLGKAGLEITVCPDGYLNADRPPARLKALSFDGGGVEFILFNGDAVERFGKDEIVLIVSGAIFETESESTLKRKRREIKRVGEHTSSTDHAVIDIYAEGHDAGFRILPHGFDFSCLGERKSMLSVENVRTLKDTMMENFPNAAFDDSYTSKIGLLDSVWPRSVRNTSKGFHRVGARVQRSVGETVSNADQFTKYSRMRRGLL